MEASPPGSARSRDRPCHSVIPTIMDTKLLKIILHRIVLKITGASDRYYDDYTIPRAVRNVISPVPSPPPATEVAP